MNARAREKKSTLIYCAVKTFIHDGNDFAYSQIQWCSQSGGGEDLSPPSILLFNRNSELCCCIYFLLLQGNL